jgi:hypothetical protein
LSTNLKNRTLVIGVLAIISPRGFAATLEFEDMSLWQMQAGTITTITFTEFAPNHLLTTQYSDWGVTFVNGTHFTYLAEAFVNDGVGMGTSPASTTPITINFARPMLSLGAEFPGGMQIKLYDGGELLHTTQFVFPPPHTGVFLGVVSDRPFTRAVLTDLLGGVALDDLHFGPPIPAPATGAIMLFGCASLVMPRRRNKP